MTELSQRSKIGVAQQDALLAAGCGGSGTPRLTSAPRRMRPRRSRQRGLRARCPQRPARRRRTSSRASASGTPFLGSDTPNAGGTRLKIMPEDTLGLLRRGVYDRQTGVEHAVEDGSLNTGGIGDSPQVVAALLPILDRGTLSRAARPTLVVGNQLVAGADRVQE